MSDGLTLEQKIQLAVNASGLTPEELPAYCDEHGLDMEDLTGWSTAYEIGGKLGVHAMLTEWKPDRLLVKEWRETLKYQLKAFRPRHLRTRNDANHVTVDEVKPLTAASIVHTPIFQLRAIHADEVGTLKWFLYWRRASGKWWPYAGHPSFDSIEQAVEEVVKDPYSCFRLHPLR